MTEVSVKGRKRGVYVCVGGGINLTFYTDEEPEQIETVEVVII